MEQKVTLTKVQEAIKQLCDNQERASRRNVLAITGGSMSTIHKLMSQIEDIEALQAAAPSDGISESLQTAIRAEIGSQVQQATEALQEQIHQLQKREQEALEALAATETKADTLNAELAALTAQADQDRQDADKARAFAADTITRQEKTVIEQQEKMRQLIENLEETRIETAKAQLLIEKAEQTTIKSETKAEQLTTELKKIQGSLAEAEKRAAVSKQKAIDLREALTKSENRASLLEDKLEGAGSV